jgi:hypothetical protein
MQRKFGYMPVKDIQEPHILYNHRIDTPFIQPACIHHGILHLSIRQQGV